MNELQTFNFNGSNVQTILINDEPYFVGKEVADILGYKNGSRDINRHVDDEDKLKYQIGTSGQNRTQIIINESGLYSLILGSDLPQAKEFKRWVTKEVLPTIRKHGAYATEEMTEKMLQDPDTMINLLQNLKKEREEKAKLENKYSQEKERRLITEQRVAELEPKADYLDSILQSDALVSITQIAKDYGMSGRAMNELLHKLKVQYKQGDTWLLYCKHQAKGWTHSETIAFKDSKGHDKVKMQTKWTQKGRLGLYELLKKHGYIPVIERKDEKTLTQS